MSSILQASHQASVEASASVSSAGRLQRSCDCGQHAPGGGECDECAKERMVLQRRSTGAAPSRSLDYSVYEVLRSPGQPLDPTTRSFMEPRFGHDFSRVRVHTDGPASQSAQALNAFAYTVGHDVVFDTGQYRPHSSEGRQLLAHELTHVVQQSKGVVPGGSGRGSWGVSDPSDDLEHQADASVSLLSGAQFPSSGASRIQPLPSPISNTIQRKPAKPAPPARPGRLPKRAQAAGKSAPKAAIVEDNQSPQTGQMTRTQFLATLREHLVRDCDAELSQSGRTAHGCPYILQTIEHYRTRPLAALLRLVRVFGGAPPGTNAAGLIGAVTARARLAARRLASSGGQRTQRKAENPGRRIPQHEPVAVQAQLGAGRRLEGTVRSQMEHSFGVDFGDIKVHTDGTASRLTASLDARAFTIGNDIAFAAGQYRPGTLPGDALIAHELAHTLQQKRPDSTANSAVAEPELENEADRAAMAALAGRNSIPQSLHPAGPGMHVQRDGVGEVALAIALLTAEVGGEVAVEEGVVVVVADVAAPAAVDVLAPAAVETLAPAAVETLAPAAVETTATAAVSSSPAVSTAVAATALASTTLSSDSPKTDEQDPQRKCFEKFPTALHCADEIGVEEMAQEFIMNRGYGYEALGECYGMGSVPAVEACNGAPGESWHCDVAAYSDPIAKVSLPARVVSIFNCLCCRPDGSTGVEWRGTHWSGG